MLLYNTTGLIFNEAIIDKEKTKLFLYTHDSGVLVLMATLSKPNGSVYFATDEIYLHLFNTNKISLQALFESTSSSMVTVVEADEFKLYVRNDADIQLCCGDKYFDTFN